MTRVRQPTQIAIIEVLQFRSRLFMSDIRKEKDSLGFVEVPSKAYYGAQTARAVDNFPISGLRAHPQLIRALGMIKSAAAQANKDLGLVDGKRADAIIQAAQGV